VSQKIFSNEPTEKDIDRILTNLRNAVVKVKVARSQARAAGVSLKRGRAPGPGSILLPIEKRKRVAIRRSVKELGWTSGDVARRIQRPHPKVCDWLAGRITSNALGDEIVALVEREKRSRGLTQREPK